MSGDILTRKQLVELAALEAGDPLLFAAAPSLLATARDRELQVIDLERRLLFRESVLCDASADLHALTEEARELGTDAHLDDLRAFVSRLVDVYAGAAGRAVVEERDALRAEVARMNDVMTNAIEVALARAESERDALRSEVAELRATMGALQASRDALWVRAAAVARAVMKRREGAPDPGRIRAAVLAALAEVHMEPPTWAESVADDVLARLQVPGVSPWGA